jgi:hypothetical protein
VAVWPGSAGARWKMELTGGAHMAVTGEKASSPGCANLKKRCLLANTLMLRRPGWAEHARVACGRKGEGVGGLARLRGRAGRLAAGLIGPNANKNSFPNKI